MRWRNGTDVISAVCLQFDATMKELGLQRLQEVLRSISVLQVGHKFDQMFVVLRCHRVCEGGFIVLSC